MLYFLLDAARCGSSLDDIKALDAGIKSLYRGRSEESLASVAPYLISLTDPVQQFISKNGWGQSWGIVADSPADADELFLHFRKFLIVQTEDYRQLYFRFYDPRVLRIFLPTCDSKQLVEFFGPVQKFLCESEDASTALVFSLENKQLRTDVTAVASVFKNTGKSNFPVTSPSASPSTASDVPPATSEAAEPAPAENKPKRRFIFGS